MKKATIADIRKRLQGITSISESRVLNNSNTFIKGAISVAENGRAQDVKRVIEEGARSKHDIPFTIYTSLFEALIERGTVSDVEKMGTFITEELVHKVRDAKAMQTVIKSRMTRAKSKLKSSEPEKIQNAVIDSLPQPITHTVESAAVEAYNNMLEKAIIYNHCDRVIENYNKISKRFNLDLLFYENSRINGVRDTVVELCNKVDTYELPLDIKFNVVIESALYGFEQNSISYSKSDILESAVDFFLFKENGAAICKSILENSVFFDKDEDMSNIEILTEEEPEDDTTTPTSDSIIENALNGFVGIENKPAIFSETENINDFEAIFKKFKQEEAASEEKPESKLRALVSKLYSKNVSNIVEGTPSLLTWIRTFFIIGSGAIPFIGPVLMVIGLIADRFISLGMDRKEVSKMLTCFNNEIKKSKDKLKTIESVDDKERMTKYIKSLEAARDKIDEYHNDLLTDEEVEKKYDEMEIDYDDISFDDDDFDIDELFESTIHNLYEVSNEFINTSNKYQIDEFDMEDIVSKLGDDDLSSVATIAASFPNIFFANSFNKGLDKNITAIRKEGYSIERVLRLNTLNGAKTILESTECRNMDSVMVYDAYANMSMINEAYAALVMIIEASEGPSQLLEASITNKLKMASMKLRNVFNKLRDKDRQISKSVDLGLNNFTKGVERALTNDNREAIIKGSILPSASKVIKLAILNAGLVVIGQPVLAIIATLGYLGTSAKFKAKERQMLTDEIEIELQMCQKYIDIAEQKNDMKALKQLLMIQRDLQRQHQRIKYKMKAELGQKYYDAKNVGD